MLRTSLLISNPTIEVSLDCVGVFVHVQEIAYFDDHMNGTGALCSRLSTDAAAVKGVRMSQISQIYFLRTIISSEYLNTVARLKKLEHYTIKYAITSEYFTFFLANNAVRKIG